MLMKLSAGLFLYDREIRKPVEFRTRSCAVFGACFQPFLSTQHFSLLITSSSSCTLIPVHLLIGEHLPTQHEFVLLLEDKLIYGAGKV